MGEIFSTPFNTTLSPFISTYTRCVQFCNRSVVSRKNQQSVPLDCSLLHSCVYLVAGDPFTSCKWCLPGKKSLGNQSQFALLTDKEGERKGIARSENWGKISYHVFE